MHALRRLPKLSLPASLLAVTAILFWRKPDAFLNPQLWAEDGVIFFQQMYLEGARSLALTYSGYYHLVPRLVAWLAEAAQYRYVPAIYNLAGLGGTWAVVAMLHSPRLGLPAPFLYSLPLVLVPHFTGEVFVNLTNVQWSLALLLLLTVLQDPPEKPRHLGIDALILVLAGLSTPLAVVVVPILALRVWLERSWRLAIETCIALFVASLQLLAFHRNPTFPTRSPGHEPWSWVELLGHKTIGTFFLGRHLPYEHSPLLFLVAGGALGAWVVWRSSRVEGGPGRRFALPGLFFGLATLAAVFFKFRDAADVLAPAAAAIRYFYVPWVTVCWALITIALQDRLSSRIPATLLLAVILHSSVTTVFRTPPFRDFEWQSYEDRLEAREHLWIPINPPDWRIKVNEPNQVPP